MNELRLKADMHDENSPESRRALRYLTVFFVGGVVAVMDELERKAAQDARALEMVERQLRPQPDRSPPALAELTDALITASDPVRAQAFYRAGDQRRHNWSEAGSKPRRN